MDGVGNDLKERWEVKERHGRADGWMEERLGPGRRRHSTGGSGCRGGCREMGGLAWRGEPGGGMEGCMKR